MTVQELIDHLKQFPPHLKVWHSDGGYCEGVEPAIEPIVVLAINAGLDGDEVDDEYFFYDPEDECDQKEYADLLPFPEQYGYIKTEGGYSKQIVLLRSVLDL